MKVFSLHPELKSGQFHERGEQRFITCMVIRALCTLLYLCGVLFICVRAVQSLSSDKRIAPHFLYYYVHSWGPWVTILFHMQKTTYKVKSIPKRIDETHWEVELTDLNSNGAFRITVQIIQSNGEFISGLVTDGPETYLDRILTLRILAGFSSYAPCTSLVDGGFEINPHIKTTEELEPEDRLIDIASPSKSE